jgi:hypothetical protein
MGADGLIKTDGIGAIFSDLKAAVDARPITVGKPTSPDIADLSANKLSLYFIHDLVLFVGPVTHAELIDVLIAAFGKRSFDAAKSLLGILREARLILSNQVGSDWVYRAVTTTPFLQYATDTNTLMAAFRRYHLQTNTERFADEHRGTHVERPVSTAIAA